MCAFRERARSPRASVVSSPARGIPQKTQTIKFPDLAVVARVPFWSFCAGQRRIGPGQKTTDHGRNIEIETKPECRVYFFPTTVPAAVCLFCRRPKHTTDDTTTTKTRDTKPGSFAIARPVPCVERVGSGHGGQWLRNANHSGRPSRRLLLTEPDRFPRAANRLLGRQWIVFWRKAGPFAADC